MGLFKNKVGRPSKSVLKARRILNGMLLVFVFVATFSLTYILVNVGTKKIKGETTFPGYMNISCQKETACYEAGFHDEN